MFVYKSKFALVVLKVENMTVKLKRLTFNGRCFFLSIFLCYLYFLFFFVLLHNNYAEVECIEQDVQKWSSEEVSSWLRKQGFNKEAGIFQG